MLNFEPNYWYVYLIRNTKTDSIYIGLHHQVSNKAYSNSSNSVLLKEAIDSGNTAEYIVWKGKNAEKAAALETYLINLAKEHQYHLYNKNSGGGHKGGARPTILTPEDYNIGENIIIRKLYPKSIETDDEEEVNKRLTEIADKVEVAVKNKWDKEPNPYDVVYEPVDYVINLDFLQIRENAVDWENVDKVVESMLMDLDKARYLVEPVSVVKFPNGKLLRVDGTSTCYAIEKINQWPTIPVVYLDSSIFDDNETYMEVYATKRNRPKKHKGANDPKKELKARIRNYHLANQALFDRSVEDFCKKFMALFNGSYSDPAMRSNLSAYVKNIHSQNMRGENWFDYKTKDGKILDELQAKISSYFPRSKCTHVVITSLENQAVGNAMHFFGNTAVAGKDSLVVLVTHSSHETENKEEYHYERLINSFAEAGFVLDKKKIKNGYVPFVSKSTGKKVFVIFLPCRVNTKNKIGADYIIEQLFDAEQIAA
jgi:hypothetical protein